MIVLLYSQLFEQSLNCFPQCLYLHEGLYFIYVLFPHHQHFLSFSFLDNSYSNQDKSEMGFIFFFFCFCYFKTFIYFCIYLFCLCGESAVIGMCQVQEQLAVILPDRHLYPMSIYLIGPQGWNLCIGLVYVFLVAKDVALAPASCLNCNCEASCSLTTCPTALFPSLTSTPEHFSIPSQGILSACITSKEV